MKNTPKSLIHTVIFLLVTALYASMGIAVILYLPNAAEKFVSVIGEYAALIAPIPYIWVLPTAMLIALFCLLLIQFYRLWKNRDDKVHRPMWIAIGITCMTSLVSGTNPPTAVLWLVKMATVFIFLPTFGTWVAWLLWKTGGEETFTFCKFALRFVSICVLFMFLITLLWCMGNIPA